MDSLAPSRTAELTGTAMRVRGFTLVELVVTVAVAGILSTTAYGSYQNHMLRTNRSAAQQFMLEVVNRQELYLLDARVYASAVGNTGLGLTPKPRVANRYTIAIALTAGPPPGYVITATPIGSQLTDGVMTLASDGTQTPINKWQ